MHRQQPLTTHPRNPITVHIARLLTQVAATCTNCAVCPIHEAAAELAAYLTKDLT